MGVQESTYLFANISHESIQGIHIIIFGLKKNEYLLHLRFSAVQLGLKTVIITKTRFWFQWKNKYNGLTGSSLIFPFVTLTGSFLSAIEVKICKEI